MNKKSKSAWATFTLEKAKAEFAGSVLSNLSENSIERAFHWSGFIQSSKKAVAALVRCGMQSAEARPIAHKIRNWETDDRVFKYLLHARNAEVHVEEHEDTHPNPVESAQLRIGANAILVGDGVKLNLSNVDIDGLPISGSFGVVDGKPIISSFTKVPLEFTPKQIVMQPVKDQSGTIYEFAFDLIPKDDLPEQFAVRHVLERLTSWSNELHHA